MNRRAFISASLAATALSRVAPTLLLGGAAGRAAAQTAVNVVEQFGFVPDGRTDNYVAFHRFAAHVNRVGGGNYVFPPGEYYVARFRTEPQGTPNPRTRNSEIIGCDGLTITGYGARIRLNGAFHRSKRIGPDGLTVGIHTSTFMPFEIRHTRNLTIAGLEMDGGVRDMSRDIEVYEGHAHLISLNSCADVLMKDLDLHHAQVDGILLTDDFNLTGIRPGRACRNVVLDNVKCRHNGRGGLAPLQVLGLRATDCDFSGNGFPGGRYTYHPPGFGVCMEPDRAASGDVDTRTGNLEFIRCTMNDNVSAILAAYPDNYQGYCRFIDCASRNANNQPNHMILAWPDQGITIQGGVHDAGDGAVYLSWEGQKGSRTFLKGAEFRSSNIFGLVHPASDNLADVQDCALIGTHTKPESGRFPFFAQNPGQGRRNVFKRNRIFIPAARKDHSQPFDIEPTFHHTELAGNRYTTDLATPGEYFVALFDPSCRVSGERFRGAFPGPRDTFRPATSEAHDSRSPYSL